MWNLHVFKGGGGGRNTYLELLFVSNCQIQKTVNTANISGMLVVSRGRRQSEVR